MRIDYNQIMTPSPGNPTITSSRRPADAGRAVTREGVVTTGRVVIAGWVEDAGLVGAFFEARPASLGRRLLLWVCVVLGCLYGLLMVGCVERRLLITSEPSGALIKINDEPSGRTPLEVGFTWYGSYDLTLEHEGYHTLQTQRVAEMPWWEAPGPDLFAEAIPHKRVEIAWHLQMQPLTPADEVDPLQVIGHAEQLRETNRRD